MPRLRKTKKKLLPIFLILSSCATPQRPKLFVCVVDYGSGSVLCRDGKEETPIVRHVKITDLSSPQMCLPPKSFQELMDWIDEADLRLNPKN